MQVSELDKAVAYTKQFIEAATPIAKQAYDIGLVTIRIDAAGEIIMCLVMLTVAFFMAKWLKGVWKAGQEISERPENKGSYSRNSASDHIACLGIPHAIAGIACGIGVIVSVLSLANIWLWVKLISPQLWLAHKAVEVVMK